MRDFSSSGADPRSLPRMTIGTYSRPPPPVEISTEPASQIVMGTVIADLGHFEYVAKEPGTKALIKNKEQGERLQHLLALAGTSN